LDSVDDDGYCIAGAVGFTNTLRLRHSKPIVNLPGVTGDIHKDMDEGGMTKAEAVSENLRDGQIIRECIVAPEGYVVCGSDISSLEDQCKRHYMYDYDPEYVIEQMEEGFDPHLDLALRAGAITEEELELYKAGDKEVKSRLKPIRDIYKVANYSCIYKVGAEKLGKTVGMKTREAKALIQSYWDRNWSIKQLPNDIEVKTINDQMWLLNPVSRLWYSVRSERDIFSTLNQGTGAFVFDVWLKYMMSEGVIPFLQYHDEMVALIEEGREGETKRIIEESMVKVNDLLKLNVVIGVDVQFGQTYADVH
jgi:DNA polymerase I-like protein with 3'-5' exonuclease and polymerase domains